MLAACFAVLVLASGCLGWWWASAYGGNTTNAAGLQGAPAITDNNETSADKHKDSSVSRQYSTPSAVVPEKKAVFKEKPDVAAQAAAPKLQPAGNRDGGVRLSAGQMRQLIRSGKQELENVR